MFEAVAGGGGGGLGENVTYEIWATSRYLASELQCDTAAPKIKPEEALD